MVMKNEIILRQEVVLETVWKHAAHQKERRRKQITVRCVQVS